MLYRSCRLLFFTAVLWMAGCKQEEKQLFTLLDKEDTGISFRNQFFEDGPLNVANYIYFYNGGGVAVGDINNDGLQDLLFTGNMVKNRLFLNKGNMQFEDITARSGVADKQGWCTGATMADVNGDGKLDIYICRSADVDPIRRSNLLFINNGDLTFTEKAAEYGLNNTGYSTQAAFFDYDKDNDLDCFIINHSLQKYTQGVQDNVALRQERNPDFASKLYRNDNGRYTDVSDSAGITSNVLTFGLGLAISDLNNDGWPDVAVSNDFNEPDYLFINNGNGTFTDKLAECMDQVSLYSMGSDAADYNNDGHVDLVTLDMMPEDNHTQKMHSGAENFDKFQVLFNKGFYYQYSRNMLQRNNGDGTFSEVGQLAGVSNTDWSWAALFADYDNDGNKDLFVTNGYVKDYTEMDFMKYSIDRLIRSMNKQDYDPIPEYIAKMPTHGIPNYILRNNGDETFTKKTGEWGMNQPGVSAGAAYADLDNDGDLDLVTSNANEFAGIYRNNSAAGNYLRVKLEGTPGNSRGIGAKVKVYSGGRLLYQEQSPVRGFQSSIDPVLHFGLGSSSRADSVLVIWPDDRLQKFTDLKAGQTLAVQQAQARAKWNYAATPAPAYFTQQSIAAATHTENDFNDFTIQPLLPHYFSRQGPCMAVADINGDGNEDLYLGGAAGSAGKLLLQNAAGGFTEKATPAFAADAASEDVGALFFDADSDKDADLYVVSGGFELGEAGPHLQDRLYINDSRGGFTKQTSALPELPSSKSCVKAADLEGDGDLDLFVGGRVVPGKYPLVPDSYLLQNDGKGRFTDITNSVAPALRKAGMVTDAAFTDINGDRQPDLVVAGEWMAVKVFVNNRGKLVDASSTFVPFASSGWWNRIEATDLDGDNDTDLVLGNAGLNTQFKASEKEPLTIHYKDFDGNGSMDPILCYYIGGVSYPAASLDDLTDQLPGLKKKFLEYKQYANATLKDMFTPAQMEGAGQHRANMMQTLVLRNEGGKHFAPVALPQQAQYAPVYGIAAADVNGDGRKDLLLAGNNSWSRIRFGRYTANHGVLLLADEQGGYRYQPQTASGMRIRGDVRQLQLVQGKQGPRYIAGINNGPALLLQPNPNR